MPTTSPESDPFPAFEFDDWAFQYDQNVLDQGFPFTGYRQVLAETVRLAEARAGMRLLDLGVGTSNLARLFLPLGCELWGTDFSSKMVELARAKLPTAYLFIHDLCDPLPTVLDQPFERVVSAYTFHHFDLAEKIAIINRIANDLLAPNGRLVIADISFPDNPALDAVRLASGDRWDDEPYWVCTEVLPALKQILAGVSYIQVSDCAGIYVLSRQGSTPGQKDPSLTSPSRW